MDDIDYNYSKQEINLQPRNVKRDDSSDIRYYIFEDNPEVKLPSVTSILSITNHEKNTTLNNWRNRVGLEKAQAITSDARIRGTKLHENVEKFFASGKKEKSSLLESLDHVIDDISEVYIQEYPIRYHNLYAGTLDCLAQYQNKLCLIDWKTAKYYRKFDWCKDYFYQAGAYCGALYEEFGIEVDEIVIAIAVENKPAQVYTHNPIYSYNRFMERYEEYLTLVNP